MNKVDPSITIQINHPDTTSTDNQTSTVNYRLSELGYTHAYEELDGSVHVINEGGDYEPLNLNKIYERGQAKYLEDNKTQNSSFTDNLLTAGDYEQTSTVPDFGGNPPPPGGVGSWEKFVSNATYDNNCSIEHAKAPAIPSKRH